MRQSLLAVLFVISSFISGVTQTKPEQNPSSGQSQTRDQSTPSQPATDTGQPSDAQSDESQPAGSNYNQAIFQNPIPADQISFLKRFDGEAAGNVLRDKQFHKFMKSVIPDCMFHYGHDMPLLEAMETVLDHSTEPVRVRDGRYFFISGHSGPYLQGRGFLWFDLQDGIALGAFFFHPTNGEPTPAVNVFSRQVKEEFLALSELPPAFVDDLTAWSSDPRLPAITTRYFITGSNKKILLEHDEDYCPPGSADAHCQQMDADAADMDMDAANYLEQTHHVTNATAWMITGPEQKVWLQTRVRTCGDFLACRIRLTRERVRVIIRRPPRVHRAHR